MGTTPDLFYLGLMALIGFITFGILGFAGQDLAVNFRMKSVEMR